MAKIFIESVREGYSPDQCRQTMTVRELIEYLEYYNDDDEVYLSNDRGYTFGSINERSFRDTEEDNNDED